MGRQYEIHVQPARARRQPLRTTQRRLDQCVLFRHRSAANHGVLMGRSSYLAVISIKSGSDHAGDWPCDHPSHQPSRVFARCNFIIGDTRCHLTDLARSASNNYRFPRCNDTTIRRSDDRTASHNSRATRICVWRTVRGEIRQIHSDDSG